MPFFMAHGFLMQKYFSKNGCPAKGLGGDYLTGSAIRQDYLETAIKWISKNNISDYMVENQNKTKSLICGTILAQLYHG